MSQLKKLISRLPLLTGVGFIALNPLHASADAVLNPNQIQGQVNFLNNNPVIINQLNAASMNKVRIDADSIGHSEPLKSYSYTDADSALAHDFTLTVESDPLGIRYMISGFGYMHGFNGVYHFAPVESAPVYPEPSDDVSVSMNQCAGMINVNFVDQAGAPVVVSSGRIDANREHMRSGYPRLESKAHNIFVDNGAGNTTQRLLAHGDGDGYQVEVLMNSGTSLFNDLMSSICRRQITLSCDEVVEIQCTVGAHDQLGSISGNVAMLGETLTQTPVIVAQAGPFKNRRHALANADGSFDLINMVPSDVDGTNIVPYQMYTTLHFGEPGQKQMFRTPYVAQEGNRLGVKVNAGENLDLNNVFVIDPAYMEGSIRLVGPNNESGTNGLAGLTHANASRYVYAYGLHDIAANARQGALMGSVRAEFSGSYDDINDEFNGQYRANVGGLYQESSIWKQRNLSMIMINQGGVEDYQHTLVNITNELFGPQTLNPGDVATLNHEYCFNDVTLNYKSLGSKFRQPVAVIYGSYAGKDFMDRDAQYRVTYARGNGTPIAKVHAAMEGRINMSLPQGSYSITPSVTSEHDDGTSNITLLPKVNLVVGCKQTIDVSTQLLINLSDDGDTDAGRAFSGTVDSEVNVTHVTYSVNGGEEQLLCQDCGIDPAYSFNVKLDAGTHSVKVTAYDVDGNEASAAATVTVEQPPCDGSDGFTLESLLDKEMLWPPNNKLEPIGRSDTIVHACGEEISSDSVATEIWSNEAVSYKGNPAKYDAEGLNLMRQRDGRGEGRVYLLVSKVADSDGYMAHSCSAVIVPHDMSAKSIDMVKAEAAAAVAHCQESGGNAPSGFHQVNQ